LEGSLAETRLAETIDDVRSLVGQELGVGAWLEITQDRVDRFAEATGDHQWIHVDPERAAKGPFGGTIAHGYLTLSLTLLLGREMEGIKVSLKSKMGVNYGLNRVRFVSPVHVGKRIRLRSKLLNFEQPDPNIVQLTYQHTVEIEGSEKPALVSEWIGRHYL
jgi:acyl dehydratase